jgi:hypothetical protein
MAVQPNKGRPLIHCSIFLWYIGILNREFAAQLVSSDTCYNDFGFQVTGVPGSLPLVTTQPRCPRTVKLMLQETDNDVILRRQTLILIILGHVGAVMRFAAALDL